MNAKWAWSEVRIGLGDPFGLVGLLRHRDRRRPRRGRRAVHQGQRRPPPGRCKIRHIRTCIRFSSPHPKAASGRGLFCAGGGRPLGRGTAGRLARRIGRVAALAAVGRNIARRAFGNGRARRLVRPARRPGPAPTIYARHARPAFPQGRRAVCGKGAVGDRRGEGAAQGGGVLAPLRAGKAPK